MPSDSMNVMVTVCCVNGNRLWIYIVCCEMHWNHIYDIMMYKLSKEVEIRERCG